VWELLAQVVGVGVGLVTLYRLCVSPLVKDRNDAWDRIKELEAEVKRLKESE
jgi:hypothetical protein